MRVASPCRCASLVTYGMSLTEGIRRASEQPFPVQIGIEKWTEQTELQFMDYSAAMAAAQQYGVPWMWWNWVVGGVGNAMSDDGYALNALGREVSSGNPNGLMATAHLACGR